MTLPSRARVVIVGGGVIGCSIAYHLARRGWTDVVLLEQHELTSGTTWHAAGLVTQARPTHGTRAVVARSLEVFRSLEADTGLSTGYVETGTLHLATNADRWHELLLQASASKPQGIEVEILDVDATVAKYPLLNPDGVVGSLFYPYEGRATATDLTMSLAKGARQRGAQLLTGIEVTGFLRQGARVTGVTTSQGDIEAEYVVNCGGMWARQLGALAGARHPIQALAHYYVVTEGIPGLPEGLPTIKSSDDSAYVKDDAGTLMVGFFEAGSYPWSPHGIPSDASYVHLPEDWDHIGPFYEQMCERIPVLADAGIKLFFGGPESFTPDGIYHLGPAPEIPGYWVAAGFNSVGMLSGPGAGSVLADWLVDGRSPIDLPEADPARTMPFQTNRRFLEQRVTETLDLAYAMHWPYQQRESARPLRRAHLHHATAAAGAVFGELLGWERPNWYAAPGDAREEVGTYGRPTWFDRSAEEHAAVRSDVGLFDLSSFAKFEVAGPGALAVLQELSTANIDVAAGRIVYTQWLDEWGGIVADLTITRLGDERFLVLTAPACATRDLAWVRTAAAAQSAANPAAWASVTDVTGTLALVSVMGPRSRDLLAGLTDADLSDAAFPFGESREIDLGLGFVRATRITYVGELGWELLVPWELAEHVWDTVREAGARPCGYYALNSLRLEKAYRSWGHDITAGDTPLEAGLGFCVDWSKEFRGKAALAAQRAAGVERRLVQFVLADPEPLLLHDEPVWRDGELVGHIVSAGYGHSLGGAVGLGYVSAPVGTPRDWFTGDYEIEVACQRYAAHGSLRPAYDPGSERIRG